MRVEEEIMVTCDACQTQNQVHIDNILDYHCTNCKTPVLVLKQSIHDSVLKEIDAAIDDLDIVIGRAMYGSMCSKEARDWIEYEANIISNTLNKAREYIKEAEDDR